MFQIKMFAHNENCPIRVRIDGCPESGVEAVDFRRANGLPEEPTDVIALTVATVTDEESARLLPLNDYADFEPIYSFRQSCAKGSELKMRYPSNLGRDNMPVVSVEAVRDWIAEPNGPNAVALYRSVQEIDRRERDLAAANLAAELKAKEDKAAAIEAARELLKDEFDKLTSRIKYLEGELLEAREKIAEFEESTV